MNSQDLRKLKIPEAPGVYFFKEGKETLYVGRATFLNDRIKSYFSKDLAERRGERMENMVFKADAISWLETDSVLEAIIAEANFIKKLQPPYNIEEKDDKSFWHVVFTKEDFPAVLLERGKNISSRNDNVENGVQNFSAVFGPFPNGGALKEGLKIIRRIFPFRDAKCRPFSGGKRPAGIFAKSKPCFNRQIGLCPGVCTGEISKKEYAKMIKNLKLFFQGKKTKIIADMEKEMLSLADKNEFEEAGEIKKKIFALNHLRAVSLIKNDAINNNFSSTKTATIRIETYDIAHLSGRESVGVMAVIEDGIAKKSDYRIFNLKTALAGDDISGLREIISRRLKHKEWPLPDILAVDGGEAQKNATTEEIASANLVGRISVVSVKKDDRHKPEKILGDKKIAEKFSKEIILANFEAHRFAIKNHRKKRARIFSRGM